MEHEFWQDKWLRNEIGFHQNSVNAYLQKHWAELSIAPHATVFVPLCGKSHDIWWINQKGHPVIGVELSDIACKDLFREAGLTAQVHQEPPFVQYRHADVNILCGDYFQLNAESLHHCGAVFDRAALIALPKPMRADYVNKLAVILPSRITILLVCMNYPEGEMQGPPFSVSADEVELLYEKHFSVSKIHSYELGADDPFAKRKGLSQLREDVYVISR